MRLFFLILLLAGCASKPTVKETNAYRINGQVYYFTLFTDGTITMSAPPHGDEFHVLRWADGRLGWYCADCER